MKLTKSETTMKPGSSPFRIHRLYKEDSTGKADDKSHCIYIKAKIESSWYSTDALLVNPEEIKEAYKQIVSDFIRYHQLKKATSGVYTIGYIKHVVCSYFGKSPRDIFVKCRDRTLVEKRQIAQYFCCMKTQESLANIGFHTGGKDHATVLHAKKTIINLIETDKRIRSIVEELEARL